MAWTLLPLGVMNMAFGKTLAGAFVVTGLWLSDAWGAAFADDPRLSWIVYAVIAVAAVLGIIAITNKEFLTRILGRLGHSSGDERGPKPGDGAVIHHSSGEADFDGSPESVPPPVKDPEGNLPYPRNKAAD